MRFFVNIWLVFGSVLLAEERPLNPFDPSNWETTEIRLSEQQYLTDFFDSGLRPYRLPSSENTSLELKHQKLAFSFGGLALPDFAAEYANLQIYEPWIVHQIRGVSHPLNTQNAREMMLAWLFALTGSQETKNLEGYLDAVEQATSWSEINKYYPNNFSVTHNLSENVRLGLSFRATPSIVTETPLIMYLDITWTSFKARKDRKRYNAPIPPPPGYEKVSMEAPEHFGPDSAAVIAAWKRDNWGVEPNNYYLVEEDGTLVRKAISSIEKPKPSQRSQPVSEAVPTQKEEESPQALLWLYWVLGALILGGIGVSVWNSRKGSTES